MVGTDIVGQVLGGFWARVVGIRYIFNKNGSSEDRFLLENLIEPVC